MLKHYPRSFFKIFLIGCIFFPQLSIAAALYIFQTEKFDTYSGNYTNQSFLKVSFLLNDPIPESTIFSNSQDSTFPNITFKIFRDSINYDSLSNWTPTEDSFVRTDVNGAIIEWYLQAASQTHTAIIQGDTSGVMSSEISFLGNTGTSTNGSWTEPDLPPVSEVPLPASFIFFGTGLLALVKLTLTRGSKRPHTAAH